MAVSLTQPATLANLKQTVENMKVYIDSDKTVSIKGYLKKDNTYNFYNTSTPTAETTPIFSFDIATEYFLDQTKTTFVQKFEWAEAVYAGSTNPNLEGKPVFVLAVKGEDTVSYSFVNLETLTDTYRTKNTTTLSLGIIDNEISGDVNISAEEGNAVVTKSDGLYVPAITETKVSELEGNTIETKDDGIYVKDMSTKISEEEGNAIVEKQDGIYAPTATGIKISEVTDNIIETKDDGIYVAPINLDDYVKTKVLTYADYVTLTSTDPNTIYYCKDNGFIFYNNIPYGNSAMLTIKNLETDGVIFPCTTKEFFDNYAYTGMDYFVQIMKTQITDLPDSGILSVKVHPSGGRIDAQIYTNSGSRYEAVMLDDRSWVWKKILLEGDVTSSIITSLDELGVDSTDTSVTVAIATIISKGAFSVLEFGGNHPKFAGKPAQANELGVLMYKPCSESDDNGDYDYSLVTWFDVSEGIMYQGYYNDGEGAITWKNNTKVEVVKTYTNLADLDLTSPVVVYDIESALPTNAKFVGVVGTSQVTDIPGTGTLTIEITSAADTIAKFHMNDKWYDGVMASNHTYTWHEVAYVNVITDIVDLGLSYPQTTRAILNAMKVGEKAEFTVTNEQLTNMPGHHLSGVLTINKVSTNWGNIQFQAEEEYFIAMIVGIDVHWYQIATTEDLPKFYDDALSLTGSTTSTAMKDICYCLSNGETFAGNITPSFVTDAPDAGFLVVRAFTGGYEIELLSDNNVIYEGVWKNNVVTWHKITSSNIARTPMNTTTYFPSSTNYTYDGGTGANAVINCFEVKNGICTVNVMVKCVSPVTSFTNIIANLPKNNGAYYNGVVPSYAIGSFGESFLGWRMNNGGTGISLCGGTAGHTYPITFSYPVAE